MHTIEAPKKILVSIQSKCMLHFIFIVLVLKSFHKTSQVLSNKIALLSQCVEFKPSCEISYMKQGRSPFYCDTLTFLKSMEILKSYKLKFNSISPQYKCTSSS
ncbi:hypothetical protein AQUCO_00400098v1 [Aquilegia coerulea]|uniref:Uncharacterized protein n=1 Tax=Aquilegia coerulea TaxID=218851 RepID=A0A2G5ETF9_AQUCA|nr:hypothetical protein AQUCO_00400098v1 [Aquilegia coerulea]